MTRLPDFLIRPFGFFPSLAVYFEPQQAPQWRLLRTLTEPLLDQQEQTVEADHRSEVMLG